MGERPHFSGCGPWNGMPRPPSTFDDIHKAHAKEVLTLVWALGVTDGEERKDVAQEVWLTVARHLTSYEHRSPRVWLATITRNAVKTWRRTRKRRPEFSVPADDGAELVERRTPEVATEEEERREAILRFLLLAVPDEERREAFLLHTVLGLTALEVAETMGVSLEKAQARLQMARRDIERAKQALSEEDREKLRAVVVPFASVDEMMNELRSSVSDQEVADVRQRVAERLVLEGTGPSVPESAAPAAQAPAAAPGYVVTGGQIAGGLVGMFVVGALAGAGALYMLLANDTREPPPRDSAPRASVVDIDPREPTEPRDGPPTADSTAAPTGTSAQPLAPSSNAAPVSTTTPSRAGLGSGDAPDASTLLGRARQAVVNAPRDALAIVDEHERRYPHIDVARREEIAVRALVQLGERGAAEARASTLVRSTPSMRAAMEDLLGRRFP